jgi:hypothetical protein
VPEGLLVLVPLWPLVPGDAVVPVLDPELVCAIIHALATSRIARICSKRFIVFSPYVIVPSRSLLPQSFKLLKFGSARLQMAKGCSKEESASSCSLQ